VSKVHCGSNIQIDHFHIPHFKYTPNVPIYSFQNNIHVSKVHCGSAFEPGASGLPHYCTPPVCIPDVIGALAVWRQNTQKKKSGVHSPHSHTHSSPRHTPVEHDTCLCPPSPVPTLSPLTRGTDTDNRNFSFFFFPVQSRGTEHSAAVQGGHLLCR